MELSLFLLTFMLFWKSSTSIQCYQCVAELTYTAVVEPKCDHFDGSERFVVNCPDSSMCYKKVTVLDLTNGMTTKSYHRGCAAQTLSGDQKKINGTWRRVNDIHDVYAEDCKPDDTDVDRITNTLHCYCRGNLCNGSRARELSIAALITSVLLVVAVTYG